VDLQIAKHCLFPGRGPSAREVLKVCGKRLALFSVVVGRWTSSGPVVPESINCRRTCGEASPRMRNHP